VRDTVLSDVRLAALLAALPQLACLRVDGCRKLTAAAVARVTRATAAAPRRPLAALTLQRCFQLTQSVLTDTLALSWLPGSRLRCVTLSHLLLGEWLAPGSDWDAACAAALAAAHGAAPSASALTRALAPAPAPRPAASGVTSIALNCCEGVHLGTLLGLARSAPALKRLFLGGSRLAAPCDDTLAALPPAWAAGLAAALRVASDQRCLAARRCANHSSPPDSPAFAALQVRLATRAGARESADAAVGGMEARAVALAAHLVCAALFLPHLRVLELSTGQELGFKGWGSRVEN